MADPSVSVIPSSRYAGPVLVSRPTTHGTSSVAVDNCRRTTCQNTGRSPKLIASPDADVRYYAAYALVECRDDTLAKPIVALAKEQATRTQEVALQMAAKLSAEASLILREASPKTSSCLSLNPPTVLASTVPDILMA